MNRFLWEQWTQQGSLSARAQREGGVLAALRRGANTEPGTEPALWPYYTKLDDEGSLTRALRAEHVCLVAFGAHQQGQRLPVHQPKVRLGDALRLVRGSAKYSTEAVDAHVTRLATSSQMDGVAHHLGSLIQLMKAIKQDLGFDYTELFYDLVRLQDDLKSGRVRRRWGAAYFRPDTKTNQE